ncbi:MULTISPECIES: hypothetical protein [Burkholderia]|uniref:hypothetical protein n=1 Tax=Burkholderia TaxID=32008 RepID=UPI000A5DAC57|nr:MULTISPECIES: hypothetical protein [Burkholderia cepacia complex]MBD1410244.1 hypothetical protein [Burkholderia contaminans]MBR7908576.1 hypothetical protein [Burkholderia vietnamiensis]UXZ70023.1 hypothetical protein NUJ29_31060 [Burkholderia contaminans]UXZ76730.1 hypothetical protein NUJ30_25460 [Burkholderia contaminans]HDR8930075.1 hypothetical protein [Burkholderia vietnamiensis]
MSFLDRLKEPSSQAGLGVLAGAAVQLGANPSKVGAIAALIQALLGAVAVFVPEKAGS